MWPRCRITSATGPTHRDLGSRPGRRVAAVAARTSTLRLTTCVTQIPLRNPAILANQAVTADQISGGRIELGLGTGLTIDPSYEMTGLPNWTNGERVDRFGEYVELLGKLLAGGVTTYQGNYYQANGAVMNPGSVQQPRLPIMVAALGPQMMHHAARHADIWNTMSFAADLDEQIGELADRCTTMDEICADDRPRPRHAAPVVHHVRSQRRAPAAA